MRRRSSAADMERRVADLGTQLRAAAAAWADATRVDRDDVRDRGRPLGRAELEAVLADLASLLAELRDGVAAEAAQAAEWMSRAESAVVQRRDDLARESLERHAAHAEAAAQLDAERVRAEAAHAELATLLSRL